MCFSLAAAAALCTDAEALAKLDKTKIGVLAGSGMGGLTVFQDGVKALVAKGPKKMTPFFIPYAITNVGFKI
jgi:3-oxoacyl-[acyl-carrier-protein] synthase II